MTPHLVWDWNGTLLDDRTLLVESVVSLAREEGIADITAETVTARFARPLRAYFESVLERPLMSSEWAGLERRFHDFYRAGLSGVSPMRTVRSGSSWRSSSRASSSVNLSASAVRRPRTWSNRWLIPWCATAWRSSA